jgi:parvulin-like peptidyl-prolyl isomerase
MRNLTSLRQERVPPRRLTPACQHTRSLVFAGNRGTVAALAAVLALLTLLTSGCGTPAPSAPTLPPVQQTPAEQASLTPPDSTATLTSTYVPPTPSTTTQPTTISTDQEGATQDGRPLIARVNGEPIFLDVYQKQVAQTVQALAEQGILLDGADGEAQIAQIQENIIKGLIEQELIEQAAARMQVSVTDQELQESLQASVNQGQEPVEQWLSQNDMTMEDLQEMQRSQLIAGRMIEVVTGALPTSAEQVHARHIFTSDANGAQAVWQRLNTGENFAAVAQQESGDPSTAPNGGDLGWFPRDAPMMPASVVDAAFTLQPGEISDVIQSEAGYHVVKVEARENRPLGPEMLLYARQQAFHTWLAEQWAQATIDRFDAR